MIYRLEYEMDLNDGGLIDAKAAISLNVLGLQVSYI